MNDWRITGRVQGGLGQGAGFTGLDWARNAFIERLGIDPWPGTLNLALDSQADLETWQRLRATPGVPLPAGDPGACDARCYPVQLEGRLPAAIVLPEVEAYPEDKIELVAAVGLREWLGLSDGDRVTLSPAGAANIDTVIFDVDGTLVNSVDAYHIAAGLAAEAHGYEVTREMVREALNTMQPFWELVLPKAMHGDEDLKRSLGEATMRHWPEVLSAHVTPFEGIGDTLTTMRTAGLRLGIFSGSRGESFAPLEESGLLALFDAVLTANDVSQTKPHPEGLLSCMQRLGSTPEKTIYVGDTAPDIEAALAAGMLAVGMLTGAADSATLSRAGAHRLAASHHALVEIVGLNINK